MKTQQNLAAHVPEFPGTWLITGPKQTHQDQLALHTAMDRWAKGDIRIAFCCQDPLDGNAFIDQSKNWLREQDLSNNAMKLLERDVTYIKNCDSMRPNDLAEEIQKHADGSDVLVIKDVSRHFNHAGGFWHQYTPQILQMSNALVLLVAGTDFRGANGPDPKYWQNVWKVSDYNPYAGLRERVNNAVLVTRTRNGEVLPAIILRDTPGICSWLWRATDEEPVAA
jgi:hypothetical protein